jgi:hypothetical protein
VAAIHAYFDPLTLLPAFAAVTQHIGLVATATTSYNEPFPIARKFASLDHISGGRADWNVVTSSNVSEAYNFGREAHYEHAERYDRAIGPSNLTMTSGGAILANLEQAAAVDTGLERQMEDKNGSP